MDLALILKACIASFIGWLIYRIVFGIILPPLSFPRNVPVVPLWVSILGFLKDQNGMPKYGQDEIYKKHIRDRMKTKGAVAMWFGGRWNIIVGHPELIRPVLDKVDVFSKSGNHEKIPNSVLAHLTGENIISATGDIWRKFRKVFNPIMREDWSPSTFAFKTRDFIDNIQKEKETHMNELVQRFTMDCIGSSLFTTEFGTLKNKNNPISVMHAAIKRNIFKPLFLFFPILDELRLPSRQKVKHMIDKLYLQILEAIEASPTKSETNLLSAMRKAVDAGQWTDKQFRDNCMITFIAGHENTQQAITSLLYYLAINKEVQLKARDAVKQVGIDADSTPSAEQLAKCVYLRKVLKEVLRIAPPIPQLVNRKVNTDIWLGDILIPAETYVGWHAFGVHHNEDVWNNPDEFNPDRFDDDLKPIDNPAACQRYAWMPFSGGGRQCLGVKLAETEILVFASMMLAEFEWALANPTATVKMTPGGILAPINLRLTFSKIN